MAENVDKYTQNLNSAAVLKKEGNDAYSSKDYRKAIGKYHRALLHLRAVAQPTDIAPINLENQQKPTEEMMEEKAHLQSACYNNLAACLLARGNPDYSKIVEYCKKVIEYDSHNSKAIFRMGTALHHLGRLDEAHDILTSSPVCQTAKEIQNLLTVVKAANKAQDQKLKETYSKMFASEPKKSPSKLNGQSDPILIKPNSCTAATANCPEQTLPDTAASTAAGDQGAKFIEVDNAEGEAPC